MPMGPRLNLACRAGSPPPAWKRVCRWAFNLDDHGAAKLFAVFPLSLPLHAAPADLKHMVEQLELAGIDTHVDQARVPEVPCPSHRRVLRGEMCPRCQEPLACPVCLAVHGLCPECVQRQARTTRFRNLRVGVLLLLLVLVALGTLRDDRRIKNWRLPVTVAVHPVAADPEVLGAVQALSVADFQPVADFLAAEAARVGLPNAAPVRVLAGPALTRVPPPPPDAGSSVLAIAAWSLELRWWSWRAQRQPGQPGGQVHLYVVYHPEGQADSLQHSLGLEKGHLGVVHTTPDPRMRNWTLVAVTHEVLHTFGALDKYDSLEEPVFPNGFFEPGRSPRYPQARAEIMAGTIPLAPHHNRPASMLRECGLGAATLREIGWVAGE